MARLDVGCLVAVLQADLDEARVVASHLDDAFRVGDRGRHRFLEEDRFSGFGGDLEDFDMREVRRADEQDVDVGVAARRLEALVSLQLAVAVFAELLCRDVQAVGTLIEDTVHSNAAEHAGDAHVFLADGAGADDRRAVVRRFRGVQVTIFADDVTLV